MIRLFSERVSFLGVSGEVKSRSWTAHANFVDELNFLRNVISTLDHFDTYFLLTNANPLRGILGTDSDDIAKEIQNLLVMPWVSQNGNTLILVSAFLSNAIDC